MTKHVFRSSVIAAEFVSHATALLQDLSLQAVGLCGLGLAIATLAVFRNVEDLFGYERDTVA